MNLSIQFWSERILRSDYLQKKRTYYTYLALEQTIYAYTLALF